MRVKDELRRSKPDSRWALALAGIILGYPAALAVGILALFLGGPTIGYLVHAIFPAMKISLPEQSYLATIGIAILLASLAFMFSFFYELGYFLIGLVVAVVFKIASKIYYICCGFMMVVIITREPDLRYLNLRNLDFRRLDWRALAAEFGLGAISGMAYWFVAVRPFCEPVRPIGRLGKSESA